MKRVLLFALAFSLLIGTLGMLPGNAADEDPWAGQETVEVDGTVYQIIRTAEEFLAIGNATGGNYILANDIDMKGQTGDLLVQLKGELILNGNGHAIYNYELTGSGDVSTFGARTGATLTLCNLTLGTLQAPVKITCTEVAKSIGAVFGYANCNFTLDGITAYVDINSTNCFAGGLMGNMQGTQGKGTVRNCKTYGSLKNGEGTGTRGGIMGQIHTGLEITISDCVSYLNMTAGGYNVGGIVGRCVSGKSVLIENCANYGAIRTTKYAGGVIGQIQPKNVTIDLTVRGCSNYGTVNGGTQSGGLFGDIGFETAVNGGVMTVENCVNYASVNGENEMSGIAGRINSQYPVVFRNCVNHGAIAGTTNTAGLCSSVSAKPVTSVVTVENFLNTGEIRAGSRGSGVIGWMWADQICNLTGCINLGSLTGIDVGGIASMAVAGLTLTDCASFTPNLNRTKETGLIGYLVSSDIDGMTGSGNRWLTIEGTDWNTAPGGTEMSAEEALNWLNSAEILARYGGFVPDNAGEAFILASPKFSAIQETAVTDGKQSVRLIGSIGNSLQYAEIGFLLAVNDTDLGVQSCRTVYESLLARDQGSMREVRASELGGTYLYALTIKNIPAVGEVNITVTPYGKSLDGTDVFYGKTYLVTYRNGQFIQATKAEESTPMNIKAGTFNILHGKDYKQYLVTQKETIDLSLTANLIRELNLDICGLNEVRNQENVTGQVNQAKEIARQLGYEYAFARAIDHLGGEYGNGLVSRYPILNTKVYPIIVPESERIQGQSYENRCLLWAELSVNGQPLTVLVTHFGLHDDEKQAATDLICELAPTCRTPLILMGDFNITSNTSYYKAIAKVLQDTVTVAAGSTLTFPSTEPKQKIDYLFINSGCRAITAYVPEQVVSDHRAFVAELII